jgi:release factor glutamine methyltransferase
MNFHEAVKITRQRLEAEGVSGGDASPLVLHALGMDGLRHTDYPMLSEDLPPEAEARLEAALAARLARQPVAQIRGWRHFWNHRFTVTPDVLDPRPETETLVAHALEVPFARVLDLGTGSGAILISLLAGRPGATGVGVDLSGAALDVARANAQSIGVAATFLQSDWFAAVTGRFDLIVANPPYIAEVEMAALAPEVRDWEPHLALTPGGDGLGAYRAITGGVGTHLSPGGRLLVEIGPSQGDAVQAMFRAAGLCDVAILTDLDGRDRVVRGLAPR